MVAMKTVNIERLRELFAYDPKTGVIRWIVDYRHLYISSGDLAGCIDRKGYRVIKVGRSTFKAHRIAWALHYGEWPVRCLDHINCDRDDNRIANLRQATNAQNNANSKSRRTGRQKGAYWDKKNQRWCSSIGIGGKKKHLGYFRTEAAAAVAFADASREIHGEFSRVEAR
jgi:hypothetical protein